MQLWLQNLTVAEVRRLSSDDLNEIISDTLPGHAAVRAMCEAELASRANWKVSAGRAFWIGLVVMFVAIAELALMILR